MESSSELPVRRSARRLGTLLLVVVAHGACIGAARASDSGVPLDVYGRRAGAVDDMRLDGLRGGFSVGELRVSLALERTTSVNGELVASTRFNVPDLSAITPAQARSVAAALGQASLVQIGPGNRFDALPAGFAGTVVQNSLDNQVIRQTTVIDSTSNSLGLLSAANAQLALREALAVPLTGR